MNPLREPSTSSIDAETINAMHKNGSVETMSWDTQLAQAESRGYKEDKVISVNKHGICIERGNKDYIDGEKRECPSKRTAWALESWALRTLHRWATLTYPKFVLGVHMWFKPYAGCLSNGSSNIREFASRTPTIGLVIHQFIPVSSTTKLSESTCVHNSKFVKLLWR